MPLVAGREKGAGGRRIEARDELGRARPQDIAVGGRQEIRHDQEAVAVVIGVHAVIRSITIGLAEGGGLPMRTARFTRAIASSAAASLAAWTTHNRLPVRT